MSTASNFLRARERTGWSAGLVFAAVFGLSVSGAVAGGPPTRSTEEPAETTPPVQALDTGRTPSPHHRLPFGTLHVSPTTLVAGAPDQDLTITVDPSDDPGMGSAVLRLYAPARPGYGRGVPRESIATETLELVGTEPVEVVLSDLNPPPRRYRIDLLTPDGELIERAAVQVWAQHRLPPGSEPAVGSAHAGGAPAGGRALASGAVNHNISSQAGGQAETYTAVEPDNPARVIAAVNPDGVNPQAWISNDSMRPGTDVINTLPSSSLIPAGEGGGSANLSLCCDPALAADDRGNLWYSVLTTGSSSHIVINRAAGPSATSFQAQNVAIPRATAGLQDKNMIAVDSWASSPERYHVYATWVENPGQTIVISECDATTASSCDSPDNWSVPVDVSAVGGTLSYPSVAAAPNGDVYVAWWDQTNDDITLDRCKATEDCASAASWDEDADVDDDLDPVVASPLPFFCPIISAPGGRVGPQTYVDVGPDGRVYVAYSELRNQPATTRCTPAGTDRTFESRIAAGAADTFPVLNSGIRLSDDNATALNDHFFPTLAADPSVPGQVETSLYSTKLDATGQTTQQFYVVSSDGGASYGAMQQISTAASDFSGANSDGFDYGDYAGGDAAAGLFYPSWTDNRAAHGGDAELYMLTPPPLMVPPPPGGGGGGGSADSAPPDTQITKRPKDKTKNKQATFEFTADEPATFECTLDGRQNFKPCTSPLKLRVKRGRHNLEVRATDTAGNADPTPATDGWKVRKKKKK